MRQKGGGELSEALKTSDIGQTKQSVVQTISLPVRGDQKETSMDSVDVSIDQKETGIKSMDVCF